MVDREKLFDELISSNKKFIKVFSEKRSKALTRGDDREAAGCKQVIDLAEKYISDLEAARQTK